MATLRAADQEVSYVLGQNDQLTVTAPAGSSVRVFDPIDGSPDSTVSGATATFGPYAVRQNLRLKCSAGAVSWSVASAQVPATVGGTVIDAQANTLSASSVQGGGIAYPAAAALPAGALAEWQFDEGAGAAVRDRVAGAYPINLALPASQVYQWTGSGVDTSGGGMVQTPSIPGARTQVMLYRTGRNESGGFLISGASASGVGLLQDTLYSAAGWNYHALANGRTIVPPRANPLPTRNHAVALNRGGWVLVFQEMDHAYTTALGFGGRIHITTNRCTTFEIAYAAVYGRTLDDTDRAQIAQRVRNLTARRGIVLHTDDARTKAAGVLLTGDSNAAGTAVYGALLSSLSTWQAAQAYTPTKMLLANLATRPTVPAVVPVNGSTVIGSDLKYGPELGIASARNRDTYPLRALTELRLLKHALGSTYISPVGTGGIGITSTYNINAVGAGSTINGTLYQTIYQDWLDLIQSEAMLGVGIVPSGLGIMLGTNDTMITNANIGALYKTAMLEFITALRLQLGDSALPVAMVQVRSDIGTGVPASKTAIRQAQADMAAGDSQIVLVPTDHLQMGSDGVHYQTAMFQLGNDIYQALASV